MGSKLFKPERPADASDGPDGPEALYQPNGLYPSCAWDTRTVKRMVMTKQVAPRYPPAPTEAPGLDECLICNNDYAIAALNHTKCCRKFICTECYLQVQVPAMTTPCPFCSAAGLGVMFGAHISMPADKPQTATPTESKPPSATPVTTTPVKTVSVKEREQLHSKMASQIAQEYPRPRSRTTSSGNAALPDTPPPPRRVGRAATAQAAPMPDDGAAALEELMLLEALRRSLDDARAVAATSTSAPAPASAGTTSSLTSALGMDSGVWTDTSDEDSATAPESVAAPIAPGTSFDTWTFGAEDDEPVAAATTGATASSAPPASSPPAFSLDEDEAMLRLALAMSLDLSMPAPGANAARVGGSIVSEPLDLSQLGLLLHDLDEEEEQE